MTDLIDRLRAARIQVHCQGADEFYPDPLALAAAARLEKLEAALPYAQHKSNCALRTMLPTARHESFSCTCRFEALRQLIAESEALGLYD